MLLPGVARAEDGTYGNFKYSVSDDDKVTITGLVDESATEIDIPATIDGKDVVAIGSDAFSNKNAIKSINIPSSVEEIGEGAFSNCDQLSSVNFATDGKLKTIGASAFANCHRLRSKMMIPASVEEICERAFDNTFITSVTFGENAKLKKIGRCAFISCYELSRIMIPASVEEIGDNLFLSCWSLKEIFLMRSPNSGDDISFYGKLLDGNSEAQLFVPNGSVDLYKEALSAYADCILGFLFFDGLIFKEEATKDGFACVGFSGDELKDIVIPAKVGGRFVTSIGKTAFFECSLLSSVSFAADGNLKTIGERAFQGTSLTSVNIPASVETIDFCAFADMAKLTSVSFAVDGKLRTISENAFFRAPITSINIPASVEEILYHAFMDCRLLTSVSFASDGNLKTIGEYAFQGASLTSINIPASVEKIDAGAFSDCRYLSSVTIAPDGNLKTIGERAFQLTYLTSISIPATVETIGASLFEGAPRLETVTFNRKVDGENNLENYASDIFKDCVKLKTIYVPLASKDAYCAQLSDYQDKIVVYETGASQTLTDEKGITQLETLTAFDKNTLNYSRKVETTTGEYATVCLPFAIDLSQTADVFEKVYVPETTMIHDKAHSDDTKDSFILMLKEQEADAEIPAGQPMFVKLAAGKDEFTFTNSGEVTLQKDMEPSAFNMTVLDWDGTSGLMTENRQFGISYSSRYGEPIAASADMNIWSFNDNGTFGPQSQGTLNPFRLFLHVEDLAAATQAKAYSISIGVGDDSTTGIREIIPADTIGASGSSKKYDGIIYDLNGRKVATADEVQSLPKGIYILNGKKMVVK